MGDTIYKNDKESYHIFGNKIDLLGFFRLNYDKWRTLIHCGVLSIDENDVRSKNAGLSDYATHIIQTWALWIEYANLSAFTKDMLKRLLRTKAEPGMSMRQSRMLDLKKIIHIANEELRQYEIEEMYENIDKDEQKEIEGDVTIIDSSVNNE